MSSLQRQRSPPPRNDAAPPRPVTAAQSRHSHSLESSTRGRGWAQVESPFAEEDPARLWKAFGTNRHGYEVIENPLDSATVSDRLDLSALEDAEQPKTPRSRFREREAFAEKHRARDRALRDAQEQYTMHEDTPEDTWRFLRDDGGKEEGWSPQGACRGGHGDDAAGGLQPHTQTVQAFKVTIVLRVGGDDGSAPPAPAPAPPASPPGFAEQFYSKVLADTWRQVSAAGTPSKPEPSPGSKGQPAPGPSTRPPGSEPPQRSPDPGGHSTGQTPPPAGADSRGALLRRSVAALTGALMCDVTLEALTTEDGVPVDPAAADVATPRAAAVVAMSRPIHTHNRAELPAPAGAGAGGGGGGGGGGEQASVGGAALSASLRETYFEKKPWALAFDDGGYGGRRAGERDGNGAEPIIGVAPSASGEKKSRLEADPEAYVAAKAAAKERNEALSSRARAAARPYARPVRGPKKKTSDTGHTA